MKPLLLAMFAPGSPQQCFPQPNHRPARRYYTEWFDGMAELYDRDADLHEIANLASLPAHSPMLKELQRVLANGWTAALPD